MDELIEIVRQYNVIYNTRSKHYKDHAIRTAIWEEIGEKLKQPAEKCKDDWEKLRNAYTNALKRRKNKKSGQAAVNATPWKYEEQMSFLQPFIKSRPSLTTVMSPPGPPENFSPSNLPPESPDPQSHEDDQSEDRSETPLSGTSTTSQRSVRNNRTTNLKDLYEIMKSSHDLKVQKHSKQQDMDETDLFFFSMSKALKSLPKLDQTKIKLDLHTAISQAEIRKLQRQETNITPVNVTHQIVQPQKEFQPPVQPSTSTILPSTSTITLLTASSPMEQTVSTLYSFGEENISSYYSNADFTVDNN